MEKLRKREIFTVILLVLKKFFISNKFSSKKIGEYFEQAHRNYSEGGLFLGGEGVGVHA